MIPPRRPIVAIDGPTGAGKSTVARAVAERLGYRVVETGAMYRSVALAALRRGIAPDEREALARLAEAVSIEFQSRGGEVRVLLDGEDVTDLIRAPEVSDAASRVSAIPEVRAALVARQQAMAREGGVVMEGRDIGTVVVPDAEVKVFLHASLDARARRRHSELLARGLQADLDEIRRQEAERDRRDQGRAISPLRPAPDAVVMDSTHLSAGEVAEAIVRLVRTRIGAG